MTRPLIATLVVFLITVSLSGCATRLYVPGNRFMNPEASGDLLKGDFKIGGVGVTHVQLADDMTSTTPDTTPILLKNSSMLLGVQLGLATKFDLYYNSVYGAPGAFGGKFQIVGEPQSTAKKGNFSLAVAAGAFVGKMTQTTEVGGVNGQAALDFGGHEIMIPIGYRVDDGILLYLTPFQSRVKADVDIKRTSGGVTTTTAQPSGYGVMRGISLGIRLGGAFFLGVEASGTRTVWTREQPTVLESQEFNDTAIGATIGGQW